MSSVTIKKVKTRKDLEKFIDFHDDLYEGCEQDVPNLFSDEMKTLDKTKNAAFEFSEAEYFMAFYQDGRMAGGVAAIINHRANKRWGRKCVRFGWIDFVDDIEVSAALFKAVEDYGRSKGMDEMIGPLGFTDLDPEGMLTWAHKIGKSRNITRRRGVYPVTPPGITNIARNNTKTTFLTPCNHFICNIIVAGCIGLTACGMNITACYTVKTRVIHRFHVFI